MNDMNTVVKEPDLDVLELIDLMGMLKQTNQEKHEILNPIFQRLNLYCDEVSFRLDKDSDLFSIPLDVIYSVEYEEDGDTLFILFKKNNTFHSISINQKVHIIYATKYKHNSFKSFFSHIYNRIRINLIMYKLKRKFKNYIKEKLNRSV